jgi:hypothetical protein
MKQFLFLLLFITFTFNGFSQSASNVSISESRSTTTGHRLIGSYTFVEGADSYPEGKSVYKWYVASNETGLNKVEISGNDSLSYLVNDSVIGKYIGFEVTPVDTHKIQGTSVIVYFGPIVDKTPTVSFSSFKGVPAYIDSTVSTTPAYSDAEGNTQYSYSIKWYSSSSKTSGYSAISGAVTSSFKITTYQKDLYIFMKYICKASSGDTTTVSFTTDTFKVQNAAPVGTLSSISGTKQINQTITATRTYTDLESDAEGASTFQWYRASSKSGSYSAIGSATSNSRTLTIDDKDAYLFLAYTPIAATGTTPGTTVHSDTILVLNTAPVGTLSTISGTKQINQNITATRTYTDLESDAEGSSTFHWYRASTKSGSYSAIGSATSNSRTLTIDDKDAYLFLAYTPVAATGTTPGTTVHSDTILVLNTAPVGTLSTISGTKQINQTITATRTYTDLESDAEGSSTFQWYRASSKSGSYSAIGSATSNSRTLTIDDKDAYLFLAYTPVAATGTTPGTTVHSDTILVLNTAPVGTLSSISGTKQINQTITATRTYTDLESDTEGSSTFQWYRASSKSGSYSAIGSATSNSRTLTIDDKDAYLFLAYTPVAATGTTPGTTVHSDTILVLNTAPVGTLSSISGTKQINQTITATRTYTDLESDAEGSSTFQWYRASSKSGSYSAIGSATSNSRTLTINDKDAYLFLAYTPVAATGTTPGTTVHSDTILVLNTAPVGTLSSISGTKQINQTISATKTYTDLESDAEGSSTFQWYRASSKSGSYSAIGSATSNSRTLTIGDKDAYLFLAYTPIASTGTTPGTTVHSDTIKVENAAPTVKNISLTGNYYISNTITGSYTYSDVDEDSEGVTTFKWYSCSTKNGTYTEISGETANSLIIKSAQVTKYIFWAITPVALTGTLTGSAYHSDTVYINNSAPVASNLSVLGTLQYNKIATGAYTYSDADGDTEGTSTYKWYRASSSDGSDKSVITGANLTNYVIQAADTGKYICFEVTPVASTGTLTGTAVLSSFYGPISNSAPTASSIYISGTQTVCKTLTGHYTYSDTEGDAEGSSIYQWYRASTPSGTKTAIEGATSIDYTLTKDDQNKYIYFSVTPVAKKGATTGTLYYSSSTGTIYNLLPTVTFSGSTSICEGNPATITINFTGTSPFTLTYTNGTSTYTLNTTKYSYSLTVTDSGTYKGYSLVDNLNCTVSESDLTSSATIKVNELPDVQIVGLNSAYSVNGSAVSLNGTPTGGTFYGDGVVSSSNKFYPSIAGVNGSPHAIVYSYTSPTTSCSNTDTVYVTVYSADALISGIRSASTYCNFDDPFVITGVNTSNITGSFSITGNTGLVDNKDNTATIYPSLLSSGQYTITYKYTDAVTQTITSTITIESVQQAQIIGLTDLTYCKNDEPFKLYGNYSSGVFSGSGIVKAVNGGYYFEPSGSATGNNSICFKYTTSYGCSTSDTAIIKTMRIPELGFDISKVCWNNDSTYFVNISEPSDSINYWSWNFGDSQNSGTNTSYLKNPIHAYSSSGNKTVTLIGKTIEGCTDTLQNVIHLGNYPEAEFSWNKECFDSPSNITFTNNTESDDAIKSYKWIIRDTVYTTQNLSKKFYSTGSYPVKLIVVSSYYCTDTIIKTLNLRPIYALKDTSYFENFEGSKTYWYVDSVTNANWVWGTPSGTQISDTYSGSKAYYTKISGTRKSQQLVLSSQCFDFSDVKKPYAELWMKYANTENAEGAVLQYTTDGSDNWSTIGNLSSGVNWYSGNAITSKPGGQNYGWTGTELSWTQARHNLDSLSGLQNVKFRIVYGENASAEKLDGFAIDNFYLGVRTKTVLLEQFTNYSSSDARNANDTLYSILDEAGIDATLIQYHTSFPGTDTLNQVNQTDPAARALQYGISKVPVCILDGAYSSAYKYDFSSNYPNTTDISVNALLDPVFDINVTSTYNVPKIKGTATITALEDISNHKVSAYIAVVENIVVQDNGVSKTYYNVLKKLLPSAAGYSISGSWTTGQSVSVPFEWEYTTEVYNSKNVKLVAFIQDDESNQIYQTSIVDTDPITAVESLTDNTLDFKVYPNPAHEYATFVFDKYLPENCYLQIFNEGGKKVKSVSLNRGVNMLRTDVNDLPNGIYIVKLMKEGYLSNSIKLIIIR